MRTGLLVALVLAVAVPAHAGELPPCTQSVEQQVKLADLVVVATAKAKTRRKHDDLRTTFAVKQVLKGTTKKKTITVEDCWGWKCESMLFKRGQKVILLLDTLSGHFEMLGPSCEHGFNAGYVDADGPDAQAVTGAATAQ